MKEFIKKICLFGLYAALLTVGIPVAIDPYNVFHWNAIRDNGIEPNKNYIKMTYIVKNPDTFNSFMFGSSRVGAIHVENIADEACYNMEYSCGVPSEHLANLKSLVRKGIIPETVYIGVDSLSYTEKVDEHDSQQIRSSYEYSQSNPVDFYLLYLNPYMALESLGTTWGYEPEENFAENFYEYGWWCDYDRETTMDWTKAEASIGSGYFLDETLDDMAEIVELCKENNIELVVFTNPMYELTYEASVEKDYLIFLEKLAQITPYYNFSGINSITANQDNYIDTSHYNAYIGDMILDCICGGTVDENLYEEGFGRYVTSGNVNELLEILN